MTSLETAFFSPRFKPGTVNEHGQAIQKSPVELPRVAAVASGSPPGHGSQARGPSGLRQEMRRPGACLRSSQGGETQEFCTCSVLFLRNFKNCSVHYCTCLYILYFAQRTAIAQPPCSTPCATPCGPVCSTRYDVVSQISSLQWPPSSAKRVKRVGAVCGVWNL